MNASAGPDRTILGIVLILGSVLIMAFADAVVKLVSSDLLLWQIFLIRSLFAIPFLFAFFQFAKKNPKPKHVPWALARSALLVLTWLAFYASLPYLTLSIAAVAVYTNPIITVLLTAFLLNERVMGRQWLGVLVGFLGVIAILKPGTDAFSWYVFLPLLAALFYSLAMVLTRSKCRDEEPESLSMSLHILFVVTGLTGILALTVINPAPETRATYPFLIGEWMDMGPREWA